MAHSTPTVRTRELAQRAPLPEHGWSSAHGTVCAFDQLPRFARYATAWAFTWRLWVLQGTLLAWLAALLATSFLLGALLLPAGIFVMLTAAPYWALRWTLRRQLGPFHIRAVTGGIEAPLPCAHALDRAPLPLIEALDSVFMWRTMAAAALVVVTSLVFGLLLAHLGATVVWTVALSWAMLAAFPAYYHSVALTLRIHRQGWAVRLVG